MLGVMIYEATNISSNGSVHMRRVTRVVAYPHQSLLGPFLTACTPHRFLVATLSLDHASQIPTTEGQQPF